MRKVEVSTPSRLHFTLIDLNGSLGRADCGVGVAIENPGVELQVESSRELLVEGDQTNFFTETCTKALDLLGIKGKVHLVVRRSIPRHVGLGSGTQSALAVAASLCQLFGLKLEVRELARRLGRGGTSGIGVAAFERGGLIIDGGHKFGSGQEKESLVPSHFSKAPPASVVVRYRIPEDWMFVVAIPNIESGKHGTDELKVFQERCPIPEDEVSRLSRIILVKMLPALAEQDIEAFGASLKAIQQVGFKRIEVQLQHPTVREVLNFMNKQGAYGSGLSSFGPTVYALVHEESQAKELMASTQDFLSTGPGGIVSYTRVNNSGALFKLHE